MVTSRDVARFAGVSQATVSRAMTPNSGIAASTRERVLAAMETLKYVPHAGATAMKTRRSNIIGVVVADLTNPFYPEVLDELTRTIAKVGYRVVVWNTVNGSHDDALKAIREHAIDGVVFTTATHESAELKAAVERESPIVLINRSVEGIDCDQVVSNNRAGGAMVADHLVQGGRTHAAFIGGTASASTSRDRGEGFIEQMARLGHPVPNGLRFDANFTHDVSFQVTNTLLDDPSPPEAIFCANDYMAFGAIDAIRARGLSVHRDCWVIGYDDVDMASWTSFDLTTVRQPSRRMAAAGADLLIKRINDPDRPSECIEYPCELIIRGSAPSRPNRRIT